MAPKKPETTQEYIAAFPKDVQKVLQQVRATIRKVIPGAEETISYAIPTFKMNGRYVVYFSGYKNHISLYPAPKGSDALNKLIAPYRKGKGTLQFPLDKPMPLSLITKIVKVLVKENKEKTKAKKK